MQKLERSLPSIALSFVGSIALYCLTPLTPATGQITPDSTQGAENSVVTPNANVRGLPASLIEGGATRGENLFHSFSDFNVGEGLRVYFANPFGIENILTRVTGSNVSNILGTLGVNGTANLFLLNPNGISFGPNARLDIGGSFFASTASSFKFSDGSEFSATNPQAPPLLTVKVTPGVQWGASKPMGTIANTGNLAVGSGESLTLFGSTVTSSGSLTAPGGLVQVLGERVGLLDSARIDVSSETGGGTVLMGGDFQGKGEVPNALRTFVSTDSVINANALSNGNGGRVIVWADEATRFYGNISVRGGQNSGNGGFVETSGKAFLEALGNVDASAVNGVAGLWLLDPNNITIQNTDIDTNVSGNPNFTTINDNAIVTTQSIVNALNGGTSVTITTGTSGANTQLGNITVNSPINKTGGGDATLSLLANNSIFMNANITSNSNKLNVTLNSNRGGNGGVIAITNAAINSNGGDIILGGGSNPMTIPAVGTAANPIGVYLNGATLNSGVGNISIRGQGINGTSNAYGILVNNGTTIQSITGNILLNGTGGNGIELNRGVYLTGIGTKISSVDGNISLTGVGRGSGNENSGIRFDGLNNPLSSGLVVEATGTGNVTLNGEGSTTGTTFNDGIVIAFQDAQVRTKDGNITMTGIAGGTGDGSDGIEIAYGANVEAAGSGNVTLDGTGTPAGNSSSQGVYLWSSSTLRTNSGALNVTGRRGTGSNSDGIKLTQQDPNNPPFTGSGGLLGQATQTGDITLTADTISVDANSTVEGKGQLQLQPLTPNQNIIIGGTGSGLSMNTSTLNRIQPGFSQIIFGCATCSGAITLASDVTFNDSVTLRSPVGSGSINTAGFTLIGLDNATITVLANQDITTGNIINLGRGITLTSTSGFIDTTAGTIISSSELSNAGDISLQAAGDLKVSDIFADGLIGGKISLTSRATLSIDNHRVSSITTGSGTGGNVNLTAASISLTNNAEVRAMTTGSFGGQAGNIIVNASDSLELLNGGKIFSTTTGTGDAGNININTNQLRILRNSQFTSMSGDVTTGIFSIARANGNNAGNITIDTNQLIVRNDLPGSNELTGVSTAAEQGSRGNGGNLTVRASELVEVSSNQPDPFSLVLNQVPALTLAQPRTGLTTATRSSGNAGNLSIETGRLVVRDGAGVATSATETSTEGNGGTLTVKATQVELQGKGGLATSTLSSGDAGELIVNADRVTLRDGSVISSDTVSSGNAGNLTINTTQLSVSNGSRIGAATTNLGNGADITVNASDLVELVGTSADGTVPSGLFTETEGAGVAGNMRINTPKLIIKEGARVSATATATATSSAQGGSISANTSQINLSGTGGGLFAETQGVAPAGSLTLQPYNNEQTLRVNFQDDTKISASTSSNGQGGSLIVTAPESVILSGNGQLSAETSSTGEAGSATINTRHLTVQDRAQVSASTSGPGQGGNLQVNASDSVLLNNQGSLVTESSSTGAAGDLTISTRELALDNSAKVSTSTLSSQGGDITLQGLNTLTVTNSLISASTETGTAGSLSVTATESVDLRGTGGLSVEATEGGTAGDLTVKTGQMSVREGAKVTVSSPSGQAGNLNISANSLSLNRGTLSAETGTSSNEGGANINLSGLDFLLMGNESLISANARGNASGGNITIDSTFIIATPPTGSQGSDIVANAVFGNGGRVSITTQGLFGIEFRPLRTPKNDITVRSEFGLTGVFQRNSPDVDPSRGLTNLLAEFVDASRQITQNCPTRGSRSENSFTITGTGGLPPRPGDAFDSPYPTGTVRSLPGSSTSSNESPSAVAVTNPVELNSPTLNRSNTTNSHTPLVEAAGWMYGPNGEVILTAVTPNFTPHGSWSTPPTCD